MPWSTPNKQGRHAKLGAHPARERKPHKTLQPTPQPGLLGFAVLLGFITDDIRRAVTQVRRRRASHCQWQPSTPHLLLQQSQPRPSPRSLRLLIGARFNRPLPPSQVHTGNFPIVEESHTVILGWNHQTLPLLRQVGGSNKRSAARFSAPPRVPVPASPPACASASMRAPLGVR